MTLYDVAKATGTNKSNISRYESGNLYPSKNISMKLAKLFKLNTKYFFDDYLSAMDTFHDDLLYLLNKNSISKKDICSNLGISKSSLYKYMYKNKLPSRNVYMKFKIL